MLSGAGVRLLGGCLCSWFQLVRVLQPSAGSLYADTHAACMRAGRLPGFASVPVLLLLQRGSEADSILPRILICCTVGMRRYVCNVS